MLCEICGGEAEKNSKILIDQVEMVVCEACAGHGESQAGEAAALTPVRKPSKKELEEAQTLVDGYGAIIRVAREEKGLTLKELGAKLSEKPSLLQKAETEKLVPNDKLVRKLERFFKIELKELVDSVEFKKMDSPDSVRFSDYTRKTSR